MLCIVPEGQGQYLAEAFVEAAQRMEAIANFPYAVAAHRQPDALAGKHFAQVQHTAFPFDFPVVPYTANLRITAVLIARMRRG